MSLFEKYLHKRPFTEEDKVEALADYRECLTDELWDSRCKLAEQWYKTTEWCPGLRPDTYQGNHPEEYRLRGIEIQLALIDSILNERGIHSTDLPDLSQASPKNEAADRVEAGQVEDFLRNSSPDIVRRTAIIAQNPKLKAAKLCDRLDFEAVPLVAGWAEQFGVESWAAAYLKPKLRSRIDTIISKARHRLL